MAKIEHHRTHDEDGLRVESPPGYAPPGRFAVQLWAGDTRVLLTAAEAQRLLDDVASLLAATPQAVAR